MDAWLGAHRVSLSLALVVAALLGAGIYFASRPSDRPLLVTISTPATTVGGPKAYISGEIARPGVYDFEPGDRVEQLVALAGGFTADADVDSINLALRLRDEQQVHVPRLGASGATSPDSTAQPKLVDLNAASAADLEALPGIGEVTAKRIVDHRTNVGPFASAEDLLTLKLVTGATFEKVRGLVTVR